MDERAQPAAFPSAMQADSPDVKVHSQQGGFCLILGKAGTGKTILIAQPALNTLQLRINHDLKTRV